MRNSIFAVLLLSLPAFVRAQDDDSSAAEQPAAQAEGPAETPRDKPAGIAQGKADAKPTPGISRSLGKGAATSAAGRGISCENSVPKLSRVIRRNIPFPYRAPGQFTSYGHTRTYSLGPNEAISYKFTAPENGLNFTFYTMMHGVDVDDNGRPTGVNLRSEPTLISVSETPCDFDAAKAAANTPANAKGFQPCYGTTAIAAGVGPFPGLAYPLCQLVAGKTYYWNIRTYAGGRDACASDPFVSDPDNGVPNLRCGGIWVVYGSSPKSHGASTTVKEAPRRQFGAQVGLQQGQ